MKPICHTLPAVLLFACLLPVSAVPVISAISPTPGSQVAGLTSLQITFSEQVGGVDTSDLFINGAVPQTVGGTGAGPYTFTFNQPPPGTVGVEFAGDTGIAGISGSGPFVSPSSWSYTLVDTLAPTTPSQFPFPGSTAGTLTQAEVAFSEPVTGVDAADFKVNGVAATSVTGFGSGPYTFTFSQPAAGAVNFTWAAGHGIADLAGNPFGGAGWSVTRSASGAGNLIINEFTAINSSTYLDAEGDNESWVEIQNTGASTVNLGGWALTDNPDAPGKWIFPNRTLAAGAYLVVFTSGKDRRPVSGELHTNFKLGVNGGDLALVSPDRPVMFATNFAGYPAQRSGFSYGLSGGVGRYFTPPTPGAVNSATTLTAVATTPTFTSARGFYDAPFQLMLGTATVGGSVRYTTDGSEPTATTGTAYSGPITISATTVLRAATFAAGFVPSATVTHTYIFQNQVINQSNTPAGFPTTWGTSSGFTNNIVPADYGMDLDPLRVTPTNSATAQDPVKVQRYNDGLRELPSLCIATPNKSMFESTGMYHSSHVTDKNFAALPCSVEMILPDGTTAFATTSGLGMHGNASREPVKNPKHGFKMKFKPEFGPGSLDYQLFPESAVKSYDDIVIRAEFGTSWRHWSDVNGNANGSFQRSRSTSIRDQWMKDTMLEMGGVAGHSRLTHLYINGLYFGIYDLTEDPSSAFGENFLGGQKTDYDVYDQGVLAEGTSTVYTAMTSLPNATLNSTYEQFKGYLDMPAFIDYTLLHFYVGHQDWGLNKNWSAIRQRSGGTFTTEGKFRYIPWDLECILLNTDINRVPNGGTGSSTDVPSGLHTKLDNNPQYLLDFADRVHRNMIAPGGALTIAKNTSRWLKWQAIADKPIVAESCRWGDYRRDVHPYAEGTYALYTRESQWLAENTRVTDTYFPTRPAIVMGQLSTAGLYPTLNAPEIRNAGVAVGTSLVSPGYQITMALPVAGSGTTSAGIIYYTTDGTDPRIIYSGAVSSGALPYTTTLTISSATTVKARALNGTTWSALNEATFSTDNSPPLVRITELMYNPPGGDNHEYLEIFNAGPRTVDLNGWYFAGVYYVFPPGSSIAPGSHMIIAGNGSPSGWRTKYTGATPAAYYSGTLSNGGETISLLDAAGNVISSVNYKDKSPWPVSADGGGYSLEIVDPLADANNGTNWQPSAALGGSPGTANSAPVAPVITTQPLDQIVLQGTPASFVAAASGSGLGYLWKFGQTEIPGANSPTFTIPSVLPGNDGVYRCVVSNAGGSATTNFAALVVKQTYSQWIADTALIGPDTTANGDPDHDGIVNIVEFYHHLDPTVPDTGSGRAAIFNLDSNPLPGNSTVRFAWRENLRASLGSMVFEKNSNLNNPWSATTPSLLETISTDPVTGDKRLRATFPIAPEEIRNFFRMKLSH
ncbi:MAG: lamin tail domain-containing protein [Luteolibacter sp.]|uniref:lamin tail domain-containing protein n=1 Tax=Luteolibacter sp. TaxID=1962973 RepID=UPI003263940D